MLASGIFGTVAALDDETIQLEIAPGTADQGGPPGRREGARRPPGTSDRPSTTTDDRRRPADPHRRADAPRHRRPATTGRDAPADEERVAVARRRPARAHAHRVRSWSWPRCTAASRWAATGSPSSASTSQGGTRITLEATHRQRPERRPRPTSRRPRGIIDQRVNGTGVAEAEVAHPGQQQHRRRDPRQATRSDLVDTVEADRAAALPAGRRRSPRGQPQPPRRASASASPGAGSARRRAAGPTQAERHAPSLERAPAAAGRHVPSAEAAAGTRRRRPRRRRRRGPDAARRPPPRRRPPPPARHAAGDQGAPIDDPLTWMDNPGTKSARRSSRRSPAPRARAPRRSTTTRPAAGHLRRGRQQVPAVRGADRGHRAQRRLAGIPQNQQWSQLGGQHRRSQDLRRRHAADRQRHDQRAGRHQKQFAIVLDGKVISAPTVNGADPQRPGRRSPATSPQTEAQTPGQPA